MAADLSQGVAALAIETGDQLKAFGALVGTAGADPAPRALRDFLVLRGVTPCRWVWMGSSTPAGSTATTVANRVVNRFLKILQSAYPAPAGVTEQATTADGTSAAVSPDGGIQFYNLSVSGLTSANYAPTDTIARAVAYTPRVIVHWVGSNDFAANVNPATTAANIKAAIDAIDAQVSSPHVHLVVQAHERFDISNRAYPWKAYGDAARTMANAQAAGNVFTVDISEYFAVLGIAPSTKYKSDVLGLMNADKIHMLDAGHALMAEALRAQLQIPATPQAALVLADTTAPTVPTAPTATAGVTSATLNGYATSTDANSPITYLIYSSVDGYANPIGTTQSTTYQATSLQAGTAITFKVAARDPSNNTSVLSLVSNSVTPTAGTGADTTPPGAVTAKAKPKVASALIEWSAATDDTGVTNYCIYRDGALVTTVGNVLSYTDTGLTNSQRYSYTVAAKDAAGNIGAQSAAVLVVPGQIVDNFDRAIADTLGSTEDGTAWTAPQSHSLSITPSGITKRNYANDSNTATGRAINLFQNLNAQTGAFKYAIVLGAAPASAGVASGGPVFLSNADGSVLYYLGLRASSSSLVYAMFKLPSAGGAPSGMGSTGVSTLAPKSGDLIEIVRETSAPTVIKLYVNGVLVFTTGAVFPNPAGSISNFGLYQNGDAVFEYDSISFTVNAA